ncbi:hypothetical protein RhiJN_00396 [Ceratobasidium sp. AG-Ba]|nr:hypothetical protein RhiJN_00396 [Ceratobasidium sp. AG-Ba]QRW01424.1 hypothetical protein RhiLY_00421 [Ceratobasidium sp. AG-Ba]
MSTRKRNTRSTTKKQIPLDSYFSVNQKRTSPPKRLVQSSLAVHPVRSRKVPEDNDVLDLTGSTSPSRSESESPPSHKKQRTAAGPVPKGRVKRESAHHTLFDNDMSPLTSTSSPTPSSHSSRLTTPAKPDEEIRPVAVSPSPIHVRHRDSMLVDDPNDIVESSQTQYIHLQFTPSQRTRAPALTPPSNRSGSFISKLTSASRGAFDDSVTPTPGPYDWHIPSSQGEVSEPRTPRKRSWAAIDRSGTPSKHSAVSEGTVVASSSLAGSQNERSQMPPPMLPASVIPQRSSVNNVGPSAGPGPATGSKKRQRTPGKAPSSRLASLRTQATRAHPSSDDRPDHVPSSQGEPSLAPTELGTMESPRRPAPYPSIDTDLLTTIPSSNPASQEATNTSPAKPHLKIPPVARPDFAHLLHPQTPSRAHVAHREMTSSPSNLPSPRALMESLGLDSSKQGGVAAPVLVPGPSPRPVGKRALDPHFGSPKRPVLAPIQPPQDSPERGNTSSQTIVPSSQPLHDTSPPPDYDIDAAMHSFNQGQIQTRFHYSRSSLDEGSSQALPPSQSPIKDSRVDPNKSGAGMIGVFGMLGFGSEADSLGSAKPADLEQSGLRTPAVHTLPPSSPPPETPPHHQARIAQRESQFGTPGSMAKYKGSPLVLAFERARARSKSVTPVRLRAGPVPNPETQTQDETVIEDSQPKSHRRVSSVSKGKNKAYPRSQSVGVHSGIGSARPKRTPRTLRPIAPSQRSPLPIREKDADQEVVDSSDVDEQAMEIEARAPLLDIATSPVRGASRKSIVTPSKTPGRVKGKEKENARVPSTPIREERLPSSVSPSPIRVRQESVPPTRHSSPSPLGDENTQTQDETETPWETLRPSQSVSQVLERRVFEEALAEVEAQRERVLEAEREQAEAERKAKERAEAVRKRQAEKEAREAEEEARKVEEERIKKAAKAPSVPPSQGVSRSAAVLRTVSTPQSRRTMEKEIYIVTPTKIVKRTPVKTLRHRTASMTPSSPGQEDEGEDGEEYTYIDETFNPTESQMSFLNRIMNSSEAE